MGLFVPGFEGERKRSSRPARRVLSAGSARVCIHTLRLRDRFLDYLLLSYPLNLLIFGFRYQDQTQCDRAEAAKPISGRREFHSNRQIGIG
jgi:hypothetical protein